MADWLETTLERGTRLVTGHQPYRLEVIGPANGVALSVVSFDAVERIGEPYRITIELTHREDLARADYLGRDASFSINPIEGGEPRKWSGWISSFSKLKTTADFSSYRLVVEAHTAKLRLTTSTRIFQNKTAPEIIEEILRRHELRGHQFLFKLRRKSYAKHAFRMQYQQTDWDYIRLLMEKEGLYSYTVEGKHGDVQVFSDDVDGYIYEPQRTIAYRETAGLEASGREAVFGLQTHTHLEPILRWSLPVRQHRERRLAARAGQIPAPARRAHQQLPRQPTGWRSRTAGRPLGARRAGLWYRGGRRQPRLRPGVPARHQHAAKDRRAHARPG